MATIPAPTNVGLAGFDVTGTLATAATASMTMALTGNGLALAVYNNSGSTLNITQTIRKTVPKDGSGTNLTITNPTVSIATGKRYIISFGQPSFDNLADSNGEVTLGFDQTTSVTVQALRLV